MCILFWVLTILFQLYNGKELNGTCPPAPDQKEKATSQMSLRISKSSWIIQVGCKAAGAQRRPCKDRGRGQRDAKESLESPETERVKDSPLEPLEGARPCVCLDLRPLEPPDLWEDTFLLW